MRLPDHPTETEAQAEFEESVGRLVNAAHRMAKWTSVMKGEDGGAYVYAMRRADEAEGDVWRALAAWGIAVTERPPEREL